MRRSLARAILLLSLTLFGVTLLPAPAMAAGSIGALNINPDSVRGGASTTGTVELGFPDSAPTVVRLFSGDPGAAQVPVSIHDSRRPDQRHVHDHVHCFCTGNQRPDHGRHSGQHLADPHPLGECRDARRPVTDVGLVRPHVDRRGTERDGHGAVLRSHDAGRCGAAVQQQPGDRSRAPGDGGERQQLQRHVQPRDVGDQHDAGGHDHRQLVPARRRSPSSRARRQPPTSYGSRRPRGSRGCSRSRRPGRTPTRYSASTRPRGTSCSTSPTRTVVVTPISAASSPTRNRSRYAATSVARPPPY